MSRTSKRQSRPLGTEPSSGHGEGHRGAPQPTEAARASDARSRLAGRRLVIHNQPQPAPVPMKMLSVRAQNVLKELATEVTGEQPPKGPWAPPRELLLALTAQRLMTARNCGPRTTREIVAWAQGCGVTIKPSFQAGRSLSEMWTRLIANAASGALTSADVIEALEKSIRRKSVRIPIAFQIVLVKILLSSFE
jgi:hypothetical protein